MQIFEKVFEKYYSNKNNRITNIFEYIRKNFRFENEYEYEYLRKKNERIRIRIRIEIFEYRIIRDYFGFEYPSLDFSFYVLL